MEFAGIASGARRAHGGGRSGARPGRRVRRVSRRTRGSAESPLRARAVAALPVFVGDADALRSAFQNVIANAVKYSRPGGAIDVELAADDIRRFGCRVADRGIGIDRDELLDTSSSRFSADGAPSRRRCAEPASG